jgi:outer membrane lipoprotein-sorting protein
MNPSKNFAIFILSHGRPDNVITYRTLRNSGYTGRIFIIVDDEDKTLSEYKEKFRDEVIVFSKKDYESKFDLMDNFQNNKFIVYATPAMT